MIMFSYLIMITQCMLVHITYNEEKTRSFLEIKLQNVNVKIKANIKFNFTSHIDEKFNLKSCVMEWE